MKAGARRKGNSPPGGQQRRRASPDAAAAGGAGGRRASPPAPAPAAGVLTEMFAPPAAAAPAVLPPAGQHAQDGHYYEKYTRDKRKQSPGSPDGKAGRRKSPPVAPQENTSEEQAPAPESPNEAEAERFRLIAHVLDDELQGRRLPGAGGAAPKAGKNKSPGPTAAAVAAAVANKALADMDDGRQGVGGEAQEEESPPPPLLPRQAKPQKRKIKFRPAFLLTCTGFLESVDLIVLLIIVCLALFSDDCSNLSVSQSADLEDRDSDERFPAASTGKVGSTCVWLYVLLITSAATAAALTAHLALYVYRVVIAFKEVPWQVLDAVLFAVLGIAFTLIGAFLLSSSSPVSSSSAKQESGNLSSGLVAAAVLSLLVAASFVMLSANKSLRSWRGKAVQVFDDEDDFFHLRRTLRLTQIDNLRRYWLL